MATTIRPLPSSPAAPVFMNTELLALAEFLTGYSGLTRQAYELDLRQFASWCQQHQLRLFQAAVRTSSSPPVTWGPAAMHAPRSPADRAPSQGYAVEKELLDHSLAATPPACTCHPRDHRPRESSWCQGHRPGSPLSHRSGRCASLPWDQVDVLVPNETEARALLADYSAEPDMLTNDLAEAVATKLGVPTVMVPSGHRDASLMQLA